MCVKHAIAGIWCQFDRATLLEASALGLPAGAAQLGRDGARAEFESALGDRQRGVYRIRPCVILETSGQSLWSTSLPVGGCAGRGGQSGRNAGAVRGLGRNDQTSWIQGGTGRARWPRGSRGAVGSDGCVFYWRIYRVETERERRGSGPRSKTPRALGTHGAGEFPEADACSS